MLKSELNARNKIAAINTLAFPVVSYSYGIVNWKVQEIKDIDRVTRKMLCTYVSDACQEGRCRQDILTK